VKTVPPIIAAKDGNTYKEIVTRLTASGSGEIPRYGTGSGH
jgi:hypothetical protein